MSTSTSTPPSEEDTESVYFAWHKDSVHSFENQLFDLKAASPELEREMNALMARLDLQFVDADLLLLAVTDKTFEDSVANNDRLAALGDSILRSALAEYLFIRYPNLPGESISDACNELVSGNPLFHAALNIGTQHLVRSAADLTKRGTLSPNQKQITTRAFAAIVGATMVDKGTTTANEFALDMLVPVLSYCGIESFVKMAAPKKTLSSLLKQEGFPAPTYSILNETGRGTHQPTFHVGVFSGDSQLAEGASFSIATAQDSAARAALVSRYTEEVGDYQLPTQWGSYSVGDIKEWIVDFTTDDDAE